MDVYGKTKTDGNNPEHIGSGYVLPIHLKCTEGRVQTPIVSRRFQPIGQFAAAYLIVRPIADYECDMRVSYAQHWAPHWKALDVGHRGLGNSYTKSQYCSNVRENTIASLKNAAAHGADMVEFDVQISKDLVPVIYHNIELVASVATKKRSNNEKMLVPMPLKSLTLEQLQNLKVTQVEEISHGVNSSFVSDDEDDHQPFPTLEHALDALDSHIGFNVELKWDVELADGRRERHNVFEMNLFVDLILKTVLKHGGSRRIVFSSFNPDVCTMVRSKQNKYPVLFLTQCVNDKYEAYRDPRTWNVANASRFVSMAEILGMNVIADEILREPDQVAKVKARGQIIFVWTDDKNDKATVDYLKSLGLDGIVYDRMDENNSKEVKESVFLFEEEKVVTTTDDGTSAAASICSCVTSSASSTE